MDGWMLPALQALGEYGALTGASSGNAAGVISTKVNDLLAWGAAHPTTVVAAAAAIIVLVWWASSPRT